MDSTVATMKRVAPLGRPWFSTELNGFSPLGKLFDSLKSAIYNRCSHGQHGVSGSEVSGSACSPRRGFTAPLTGMAAESAANLFAKG